MPWIHQRTSRFEIVPFRSFAKVQHLDSKMTPVIVDGSALSSIPSAASIDCAANKKQQNDPPIKKPRTDAPATMDGTQQSVKQVGRQCGSIGALDCARVENLSIPTAAPWRARVSSVEFFPLIHPCGNATHCIRVTHPEHKYKEMKASCCFCGLSLSRTCRPSSNPSLAGQGQGRPLGLLWAFLSLPCDSNIEAHRSVLRLISRADRVAAREEVSLQFNVGPWLEAERPRVGLEPSEPWLIR